MAAAESTEAPIVNTPTFNVCATSFVQGLLTNATDDLVDEFGYYSDEESVSSDSESPSHKKRFLITDAEEVLSQGEPAITEEAADEDEDVFTSAAFEMELASESEEADGNDSCDFSDDVCSLASDDDTMAAQFAKMAVADDVIGEALETEELQFADCESIMDDDDMVDFLGEAPPCGDELAFNFASNILDGAFERAAGSWQKQAENKAAFEMLPAVETKKNVEIEGLKQKARESLLKAAQIKIASQAEQANTLKSRVQKALSKGVQSGGLCKALEQVMPMPKEVSIESRLRQALSKGVSSGELSKGFEKALENDKWENVRSAVAEKLATASSSGQLKAALTQVTQSKDEALALKLRQALSRGVSSGELSNRFEKALENDKWESVRSKVQEKLATAAKTGELSTALGSLQQMQQDNEAALKLKVRQAFSKGLHTGELSKQFAAALEADKWANLQSKVQQSLAAATQSGNLKSTLGQAMRKADPWECLRAKVQKSLSHSKLTTVVREALAPSQPAEVSTPSMPRSLHSSRSRRRVIGGVVRAPVKEFCLESTGEEDSAVARGSSLTRSYDTLGVQMFSLTDADDLRSSPSSASSASSRKLSKARSRLNEATSSMSAMSMDLTEMRTRHSISRTSARTSFQMPLSASHQAFTTPMPLKLTMSQKMRPSASLGSLSSSKVKAGGLMLPMLAPEKTSAESIAWTMQVSKTSPKWSNTGLRGSKSMIF